MNGITATADILELESSAVRHPWLRSARWDLSFVILSAAVAFVPYSIYLFFGGDAVQAAGVKGTPAYHARVTVNLLVTLLFGGPHMYANFTRTVMDRDYLRKRFWFVASSVLVPVGVVLLAISSYQSYVWLLSIFFALASVHSLHQLVWLSEAYKQ